LHVWQHGLFPRALAALFGQKRALKRASRRKKVFSHKFNLNARAENSDKPAGAFSHDAVDLDDDEEEHCAEKHDTEVVLEDVSESLLLDLGDAEDDANHLTPKE
jgi:hypothetical protein